MTAPTIGVCGFGRCGSSMVMAMLDAGGCPPVEGSQSVSYELPDPGSIDALDPDVLPGRAVKLLDHLGQYGGIPAAPGGWRFVWLDRDADEQARSAAKLVRWTMDIDLADWQLQVLADGMRHDRAARLGELGRHGPVAVLEFERVLANPRRSARMLRTVYPDLDIHAAVQQVQSRSPGCAPDLAQEMSGGGAR